MSKAKEADISLGVCDAHASGMVNAKTLWSKVADDNDVLTLILCNHCSTSHAFEMSLQGFDLLYP